MKNLIRSTLLLFTFSSYACWQLDGAPQVNWVAFKTPAKAGVKGGFSAITRNTKNKDKGTSLEEILTGQSAIISASKLDTKNPARDKNIRESFFNNLKGDIQARISKVSKKTIELEVIMNGVKKSVPLSYEFNEGKLKASGHLDILDFSASKALSELNKRCFALHEGKTWSHVELELLQSLKKCQ